MIISNQAAVITHPFLNPPLALTVLEVRYPELVREFNGEMIRILQEAVRDRLPVFEPQIEQQFQIVPGISTPPSTQSRPLLRFSSRDRTTALLVRSDALVLETTAYAGWSQSFRPLVAEAINALLQANRPDGVKRIGLRYIDEIRIPGVGDESGNWEGYINDPLLTAASTELIPSDMQLQQWQGRVQYSAADPTITLTVRYGPQDGYAVNPEGSTRRRNPPPPGYFFLLDSDSSWSDENEIPEYDAKWILERCDRLHSRVSEFFTTAVTDKLRNEVFNLAKRPRKEANMTTANLIDSRPTGASVRRDVVGRSESDTRTRTISDYVEDAGYLRNTTKTLECDIKGLRMIADEHHSGALQAELCDVTNKCAKESLESLLDRLSELGFSWCHIARIVGVPVSVLRKWRTGDATTGAQHRRVAELLAVCDIATTRYHISDVASWFETPMHSEVPVTCIDMASEDRFDLILQFMRDQDSEAVLDEFEPGWRDHYKSPIEVFTGPDGLPGLRLTGDLKGGVKATSK